MSDTKNLLDEWSDDVETEKDEDDASRDEDVSASKYPATITDHLNKEGETDENPSKYDGTSVFYDV